MTYIVVEPSATVRRTIRNVLRARGDGELLEAVDARKALELCDASVRLVVTEWDLDGPSGLELVRQLRERPDTAQVPVLMLSTRDLKSEVAQAAAAGINAYLLKPFVLEELEAKLDALLADATGESAQAA